MSQRSMYLHRIVTAGLVAICVLFWTSPSASSRELTFGIVPQQSASRLAKIWVPVFEHLSKELEIKIRFATTKDIPTFEACLAKGAYDFAYMNPYHYVTFHELVAYNAFAKQSDKRLRGLVVVRSDSAYGALEDLDGQPIAFPSPAAFGASVIPRAEMKKRNMSIEPNYVKSHDSVYRSIIAGIFPAGGGVLRTYNNVPEADRAKLRVLYRTDAYTPHAFAAHPRVETALIERLRESMIAISSSDAALLKPLGMAGVQQAEDSDWNDIRSLNLTRNQTEIVLDNQLTCHFD